MKFGDALEMMKRGRAIRRAIWPGGHYVQIAGGMVRIYKSRPGHPSIHGFPGADVLAEDWELLNRPLSMTEGEPLGGIQPLTMLDVRGREKRGVA